MGGDPAELVPPQEFPQAVTLGGASINLGRAIGPALGGLLVAAAGPWFVFLLNALSFGAVIGVLACVAPRSGRRRRTARAVRGRSARRDTIHVVFACAGWRSRPRRRLLGCERRIAGLAPRLLDRGARSRFRWFRAPARGLRGPCDRRGWFPSRLARAHERGCRRRDGDARRRCRTARLGAERHHRGGHGAPRVRRRGMAAVPVDPQRRVAAGGARVGPRARASRSTSACSSAASPSEAQDGVSSATRSARKAPSPGARSPWRSHLCSPCGGASAPPAVSTCPPRPCSHQKCGSLPMTLPDRYS